MKTVQIISLLPAVAGMRMDSRKWSQFNIHEHDQQQGDSENYAEDQKYYRDVNVHNGHGKPQGEVQINPNNANKGNIVKTVMHGGLLAASVLDGAHNRQARDTAACTLHNGDRFVNKNAFIRQNAICDNQFLIPGGVATYIIPKDKKKPGSSTFKIECNNSEEATMNLVATKGQFNWQGELISPDDLCAEIKAKRINQKNAKKKRNINPPTVDPNAVDDEDDYDNYSGSGNGFTTNPVVTTKPQVVVTTKPQTTEPATNAPNTSVTFQGFGDDSEDGTKDVAMNSCYVTSFGNKIKGKTQEEARHRCAEIRASDDGYVLRKLPNGDYICLKDKYKTRIENKKCSSTSCSCSDSGFYIFYSYAKDY